MTEAQPRFLNGDMKILFKTSRPGLYLILLFATALRLWHVNFGLPSLNDPDEPLFLMKALDMLRGGTLNPEWFGHPATTLFYALAALFGAIASVGIAVGVWASPNDFAAAVFANPGLLILPGRLLMVVSGVVCVYLTYCIGRRAANTQVGLMAAALLAVSPLHVELSQIIRTDVPATAFMLLSTFFAVRVAQGGGMRDIIWSGIAFGLACATKWPAALVIVGVECAIIFRAGPILQRLRQLFIAPMVGIITLILISPYLILDYEIVLRDLGGEARPFHLGATGAGWANNLLWYIAHPLFGFLGVAGLVLATIGLAASIVQSRKTASALFAPPVIFLLAISVQSLIWERWAVPLLPYAALATAFGIAWIAGRAPISLGRPLAIMVTGILVIVIGGNSITRSGERAVDTRQVASAWVRANVDPDASVVIEHAGFDLLDRPGTLLFPLGRTGCVDARGLLVKRPHYDQVSKAREGGPIVDIGTVNPARIDSCRADYAIFSHYARYTQDAARFPAQVEIYRTLARRGQVEAVVAPIADVRGGPVVHIIRLTPQPLHSVKGQR
jgi:hypothetical protein